MLAPGVKVFSHAGNVQRTGGGSVAWAIMSKEAMQEWRWVARGARLTPHTSSHMRAEQKNSATLWIPRVFKNSDHNLYAFTGFPKTLGIHRVPGPYVFMGMKILIITVMLL